MTAGAMIFGMVPMALGIGEGGEQNAPLARAVIGGLLFATFATLIFVPTMYRLVASPIGRGPSNRAPWEEPMQPPDTRTSGAPAEQPTGAAPGEAAAPEYLPDDISRTEPGAVSTQF